MSGHLQLAEALTALEGRRITDVEIDDDGGGHFKEIRLRLEGGPEVLALEIVSWGAYGEESYLNVHADGERGADRQWGPRAPVE